MKSNKLLYLSIISSCLIIIYNLFQWDLTDILTPFLMAPLTLIAYGFTCAVTLMTILNIRKRRQWWPIIIQGITILLLFVVPFTQIVLDINFKMNKSEREQVINMVQTGKLKPNTSEIPSIIPLPAKYQHLSKGGGDLLVINNGHSVLFFTFRGVTENFSGFLYSPDDKKPSSEDFGVNNIQIDKIEKSWYFISAN